MAEHHAREGFDFDVVHRVLLHLGEAADLRLGEADIVEGLLRQAGNAGVDLLLGEAEAFRRPLVELPGVLAHRRIAALFDIREDAFDGGAHLRLVAGLGLGRLALLEVLDHGSFLNAASGGVRDENWRPGRRQHGECVVGV
ncbi:hypothetical protein D9M70_589510 [compost metagenome]